MTKRLKESVHMANIACVILGAGKGTRMKSNHPKVMHQVAGRSLLGHVITAANETNAQRHCIICGPDMPQMEAEAKTFAPEATLAIQKDRLGTGHAVLMAKDALIDFEGTILILYGDVPLIQSETLKNLASLISTDMPLAVLGFETTTPKGYGRLVQNDLGNLIAIVEEKDASNEQRNIELCNSGIMAVDSKSLWPLLEKLDNKNAAQEYYLTDIVRHCVEQNKQVGIAVCGPEEVAGINDRRQLADMEQVFQNKLRSAAMESGVTMVSPQSIYLSADTIFGIDVTIEPNVFFGKGVSVGDNATIYANCHIVETSIGEGALIGPFARLRPGTDLAENTKVGNFVEIKKATIEKGAKVNHLTYIGDAHVGEKANIGAGTITCNYDGFGKAQTNIGKGAFIGSNSSLIAPVSIGDGAYVGSASVITKNVPNDALALSRAEQVNKPEWAKRFRTAKMRAKKIKESKKG